MIKYIFNVKHKLTNKIWFITYHTGNVTTAYQQSQSLKKSLEKNYISNIHIIIKNHQVAQHCTQKVLTGPKHQGKNSFKIHLIIN